MTETSISRLSAIREKIAAAARDAGRDPAAAILIAVSKTFDASGIQPVIDAGHRVFGENRVQEAQSKWPSLKSAHPDIALHLIGPLQSNKAKDAVALFDCIHTIDRPKIAEAIATEMVKQRKRLQVFVQVNTGEEDQKAGILPADASAFISACRDTWKLEIAGLMCIPPVDDMAVVHFAFLAKLAKAHGIAGLSMGMSADYEAAINLGATHVRVGSAIFGVR